MSKYLLNALNAERLFFLYKACLTPLWMVFRKMPYQQLLFPSASARWFPAPEGEGPGVGTVFLSISFCLPLSPSFNY